MEYPPESTAELREIHDLYQRRLAKALVVFSHIDLTIPAQSEVASRVMDGLTTELMEFAS